MSLLAQGRSAVSSPRRCSALLCASAVFALAACGSTTDSLGHDGVPPPPDSSTLRPLSGPASYPNPFRDVIGKSEAEIASKLSAAYERLFHGDPASEAIYFDVGADQAYIQDVLHGDVRSEGVGLGMMITLQLDRREEFDRLWRFARAALEYDSGPNRGYFRSSCGAADNPCVDPYGHQQLLTALLFAHGRWGSRSGDVDYGSEMLRLLAIMRAKEAENGGVVEGVTDMFDESAKLVVDEPHAAAADRTRPSNVMPGYYSLWAQATGDAFWSEARDSARSHFEAAAHASTGLLPLRAHFDGTPVAGSEAFEPEGHRAQLNMACDHVWFGDHPWYVTEADRLLGFFASQGIGMYCTSYTLDGATCLASILDDAGLIAVNGVTAMMASSANRAAFIDAAWNAEPPTGATRYYPGLLHLVSLLSLSGQFRVY